MASLPTPTTPLSELLNLDDFERSAELTLKPKVGGPLSTRIHRTTARPVANLPATDVPPCFSFMIFR